MFKQRWFQLALSFGISGLCLYLALRGEDWGAIRESLAGVNYSYIPAMIVLGVYGLFVRTQRWRLLLAESVNRSIDIGPVFSANAIGFMLNMVLPLRAGEVARPVLLSRKTDIPLATVLATVVVERLLDLVALVAMSIWVVGVLDAPDHVREPIRFAALLLVVAIITLFVISSQRELLLPKIDALWRILPAGIADKIIHVEHEIIDSIASIGNARVLFQAVLWSFYVWFIIVISFAIGFPLTGIEVPFLSAGTTVTTVVAFAVAAPSAPGFVGVFEGACKVALADMHGVPGPSAVAYSIAVHAIQFVTQVGIGVVWLVREGLSLSDVAQMKAPAATDEDPSS